MIASILLGGEIHPHHYLQIARDSCGSVQFSHGPGMLSFTREKL